MGTDIHFFAEVRRPLLAVPSTGHLPDEAVRELGEIGGAWDAGDPPGAAARLRALAARQVWRPLFRFDPPAGSEGRYYGRSWQAQSENYFGFDDRDYVVFGVLAGVRGWEGPQVSEARGLPEDVSLELAREFVEGEYHSCSWLTVDELVAFDWDQPVGPGYGWPPDEPLRGICSRFLDGPVRRLREAPEAAGARVVFGFDS